MQSHVVVAEETGAILGVAAMNNSGKITLNYVSPDARFRGVSTAIMQRLEAQARALGLRECVLETTQNGAPGLPELGLCQERGELPAFTDGITCYRA
jgi:N-acetylglutamate synthase-like GNAT family acetyltransferase